MGLWSVDWTVEFARVVCRDWSDELRSIILCFGDFGLQAESTGPYDCMKANFLLKC